MKTSSRREAVAELLTSAYLAKKRRDGITQADIAEYCETTQQTLSRWINGLVAPGAGKLPALIGVLDVDHTAYLAALDEDEAAEKRVRDVLGERVELLEASVAALEARIVALEAGDIPRTLDG